MNRILSILTAILLLAAAPVRADFEANVRRLPADTLWWVGVANAGQLKDKFNNGPLGTAWNDPEMDAMRTSLKDAFNEYLAALADKLLVVPEGASDEFKGLVIAFSTHYRKWIEGEMEMSEWDLGLVAEVPEDRQERVTELIHEAFKQWEKDGKWSAEEFRGNRVYRLDVEKITTDKDLPSQLRGTNYQSEVEIHVQYAFVDGCLILCEGPNEPLRKAINARVDESASLGQGEAFRRLATNMELASADLAAWANSSGLITAMAEKPAEGEADPMSRLGLDTVGPILATGTLAPDMARLRADVAVPRERKGAVSMIYAGETLRAQSATRLPADVSEATMWTFDLGAVWKTLRETMRAAEPRSDAQLAQTLESLKTDYSFDLEADLIDHVAGEHSLARHKPLPGVEDPNQTYGGKQVPAAPILPWVLQLSLQNGQQTVDSLDKVFNKLAGDPMNLPIERQEQSGFALWQVKEDAPLPAALRQSLGLTPSMLVLGSTPAEARAGLRRVAEPTENPLSEDPNFQRMLAMAPREDLRLLSYNTPDAIETRLAKVRYAAKVSETFGYEARQGENAFPSAALYKRTFGCSIAWLQITPTDIKAEWRAELKK